MTEREALKLALEALEDNQHLVADNERHAYVMEYNDLIEKCKEALAQPEQEPVAWLQFKDNEPPVVAPRNLGTPVFLGIRGGLAQPEQVGINGLTEAETNATASVFGLVNAAPYVATPRPQRKPLTDEEYSALAEQYTGADGLDCVDYGRAIARHYGIKE